MMNKIRKGIHRIAEQIWRMSIISKYTIDTITGLIKVRAVCKKYYFPETFKHAKRVKHGVKKDSHYRVSNPLFFKNIILAVALAHDLLEDTACTESEIANCFKVPGMREDFIHGLRDVTRKNGEQYFDYIKRVEVSYEIGIIVKIADLEDHLKQKETLTPSLEKRYQKAFDYLTSSDYYNY